MKSRGERKLIYNDLNKIHLALSRVLRDARMVAPKDSEIHHTIFEVPICRAISQLRKELGLPIVFDGGDVERSTEKTYKGGAV